MCAPTRELCQQIYHEARKFSKVYGLRVSVLDHGEIVKVGMYYRCVQSMAALANGNRHKISNKAQKLSLQLQSVVNVFCFSYYDDD